MIRTRFESWRGANKKNVLFFNFSSKGGQWRANRGNLWLSVLGLWSLLLSLIDYPVTFVLNNKLSRTTALGTQALGSRFRLLFFQFKPVRFWISPISYAMRCGMGWAGRLDAAAAAWCWGPGRFTRVGFHRSNPRCLAVFSFADAADKSDWFLCCLLNNNYIVFY